MYMYLEQIQVSWNKKMELALVIHSLIYFIGGLRPSADYRLKEM